MPTSEDIARHKALDAQLRLPYHAPSSYDPFPDLIDTISARQLAEKLMRSLTQTERNVIELRFFADQTLRAIGDLYGVSPERARQIEGRSLRKLRSAYTILMAPKVGKDLRDLANKTRDDAAEKKAALAKPKKKKAHRKRKFHQVASRPVPTAVRAEDLPQTWFGVTDVVRQNVRSLCSMSYINDSLELAKVAQILDQDAKALMSVTPVSYNVEAQCIVNLSTAFRIHWKYIVEHKLPGVIPLFMRELYD